MKTRDEIIQEIVTFRNRGEGGKLSWDKVAKHFGVSKPCIYRLVKEKDYRPGPENSLKLGLPYEAKVVSINGTIHQGSVSIGDKKCIECPRWFISNHPRRKKCFICSPYKGRK